MSTETLYRKVGNRYVEAGMHSDVDMYPGIWLVQKHKGSSSMSSLHLGDLPSIASLVEVVQARLIANIITDKLEPLWRDGEIVVYNRSWFEFRGMMEDAIIEHLNEGREEAIQGGYDDAKFNGIRLAKNTMNEIMEPSHKHTWHGEPLSKLYLLLDEINEVGHRKVGTHEFVWYISELKRLIKNSGYDIRETSVGGMVVNPAEEE
jgi:hypothetical protein